MTTHWDRCVEQPGYEWSARQPAAGRYQTRVLPPVEWPRLAGTEAETVWPHLDPANARVVVVEQDGVIVGTWTVLRIVHVECCWIAPTLRARGSVARRLLAGMYRTATAWGARTVMTAAVTAEVRALIAHLHGQPLPGEHFVIPLPGA